MIAALFCLRKKKKMVTQNITLIFYPLKNLLSQKFPVTITGLHSVYKHSQLEVHAKKASGYTCQSSPSSQLIPRGCLQSAGFTSSGKTLSPYLKTPRTGAIPVIVLTKATKKKSRIALKSIVFQFNSKHFSFQWDFQIQT